MFGRRKKEQQAKKEPTPKPIAIDLYAWYMGGHPMYPKARDVAVVVWNHQLEVRENIEKPAIIVIPFTKITGIQSMTQENMKLGRVLAFGLYGALWKKKDLYTVIEYTDETTGVPMNTTIVLDFGGRIEKMQSLIYQKMMEAKQSEEDLSR